MATAAPGRTTFQPRRQAGQKSGGEFAPKQVAKAAAPPPASFKDSDARRARNYRRAFANWLAAIRSAASEGVGTESLAHHWREANGIAAVAKSARDQAAMECIGATIDPEDPEAARLRCHVGRWKINWVKGLDPEACDKARAGFVEHASTAADCGEVEAMSRAVWADSAWSTSGLRDAGIEPTEVAYFNPRGYNVVPDPEDMATVCSGQGWGTGHTRGTSLSDAVSDAFSLGPPADRFLALAEFYDDAKDARDIAAAALTARMFNDGASADDGQHRRQAVVGSDGLVMGEIRQCGNYSGWRVEEIERRLREAAGGDPRRLAELTAAARSNGFRSRKSQELLPVATPQPSTSVRRVGVQEAKQSTSPAGNWREVRA